MQALATKIFKAKQKLCPAITGKDKNVKECKRMKTFPHRRCQWTYPTIARNLTFPVLIPDEEKNLT